MGDTATPFDFIGADHFRALDDRSQSIALFQRSVSMVEIEVFSYCNRVCWFCPNAVIDRRSTKHYMSEPLYLGVLDQLAEIGYSKMIAYSRYNEPLADRIILRRLAQARERLPQAHLHTNTNGDYLTRAYLQDLAAAGLGSLNIQIYLGNDERYDHERMRAKLRQTADKLGLTLTMTVDQPGAWLEASTNVHGMRVRAYARNFELNGSDRGGTVPIAAPAPRTSPCLSPFYHVYIDYNGSVMPCCNLRSDVANHADAIVARLQPDSNLFATYTNEAMAGWRRGLVGFAPKSGHCATCSFVPFEATPANVAVQTRLQQEAAQGVASR
jgi:hypothetical protein